MKKIAYSRIETLLELCSSCDCALVFLLVEALEETRPSDFNTFKQTAGAQLESEGDCSAKQNEWNARM